MDVYATPPKSSKSKESTEDTDEKKLTRLLSLDKNASSQIFTRFRSPSRATLGNALDHLLKLDLPNCNLNEKSLPKDLHEQLPNLTTLFFLKNNFTIYPSQLSLCTKLSMISFKHNKITTIKTIGKNIRWLILTDNRIEQLPEDVGECGGLQKLMLSNNLLTEFPSSIRKCSSLELVRVSCNLLTRPPMQLLSLPNLRWLACAGNPFLSKLSVHFDDVASDLISVNFTPTTPGKILGSGASGKIYQRNISGRDVAVKIYEKGVKVTSDGRALDEFRGQLFAGRLGLEHVVKCFGTCYGEGEKVEDGKSPAIPDLILELLENYTPLASPPSMTTCTRDVYSPTKYLFPSTINKYIEAMAETMHRFSNVGLAHGDFYSHNILVSEEGDIKLTDFGASFFYDTQSEYGRLIQYIEFRSFKIWCLEIMSLCEFDKADAWESQSHEDMQDFNVLLASINSRIRADTFHGNPFNEVYPFMYKCKPENFRTYPKLLRLLIGYSTATLFTMSFLALAVLPVFLHPFFWRTFGMRMFSTGVLACYGVSYMLKPREWPAFRRLAQTWYELFDFQANLSAHARKIAIKEGQSERKYIMCMHPHGIIPLQAMVWSAYCDQYFSDPITGDTLYGFGAAADVVKYLPFIKNIMGWLSAGSANYDVLKRGLDEGIAEQCNVNNNRKPRHLFLLPGGVAEVFESTVGHNAIVFKNRRGLVKLAIETGSDLLPCYVFGGTDFYHNIATGTGILSRISRKMKAGVTIFYGWFFLPLPFLPKVTLCIADPIRVEKVEGEIPKELIESIHKEYIEAIKELFEKYKVKAGYPDAVLVVK